jgi:hypothetical protein
VEVGHPLGRVGLGLVERGAGGGDHGRDEELQHHLKVSFVAAQYSGSFRSRQQEIYAGEAAMDDGRETFMEERTFYW